jgi:hypothetical protein
VGLAPHSAFCWLNYAKLLPATQRKKEFYSMEKVVTKGRPKKVGGKNYIGVFCTV